MRENNLDPSMLRRRAKEPVPGDGTVDTAECSETQDDSHDTADTPVQRQLKRQQDDSSDDSDDEEMAGRGEKQLELLNLPHDAGKYPFDSAVEKTMLRLINCLKQLRP